MKENQLYHFISIYSTAPASIITHIQTVFLQQYPYNISESSYKSDTLTSFISKAKRPPNPNSPHSSPRLKPKFPNPSTKRKEKKKSYRFLKF